MEEEYSEIETEISELSEKVNEECNEESQDDNSEENNEANSSKENLSEDSQTENESSEEELPTTKRRRVAMIREESSDEKTVKKKKPVKEIRNKKNANVSTPKQTKTTTRTNSKTTTKPSSSTTKPSSSTTKQISSTTKPSSSTPLQSMSTAPNIPAPIIPHNLEEPTLSIFLIFYNSNRPTSATELTLAFPKKAVATALDELVEKNLLTVKTYNKTKMYMLNTNVCDYETEDVYDNRLQTLKERLSALKDELSGIQKGLSEIQNQMTLDDLKEKIELRKEQMKINTINIQRIETGDLCTEKEVEDIKKKIKSYEKILKERKSIFKTALDTLGKNLNKKKNELLEEMGILED